MKQNLRVLFAAKADSLPIKGIPPINKTAKIAKKSVA